jgi:hypothetical protein
MYEIFALPIDFRRGLTYVPNMSNVQDYTHGQLAAWTGELDLLEPLAFWPTGDRHAFRTALREWISSDDETFMSLPHEEEFDELRVERFMDSIEIDDVETEADDDDQQPPDTSWREICDADE